jgi:hypothetical protein
MGKKRVVLSAMEKRVFGRMMMAAYGEECYVPQPSAVAWYVSDRRRAEDFVDYGRIAGWIVDTFVDEVQSVLLTEGISHVRVRAVIVKGMRAFA